MTGSRADEAADPPARAGARGAVGAAGAALGRALGFVSPLGCSSLVAGVVLLAVGLACAWVELVVAGVVLLAALAAAVPFALGRATYAVGIELEPRRVTAGDRAHGRLLVRNAGERRLLPARMEVPVGESLGRFDVPGLAPGESHESLFTVPTARRTVIRTGPAVSVRGDEVGLLRRTVRWTDAIELFVHPRTVALEPEASGLLHDLEGVASEALTDTDLAFHALRPYEAGDDRRHIHWRTSARTGTLMVRQFQQTRRSHLAVVQSLDASRYASDDEFELAVSVFASLVRQALRADLAVEAATELGPLPTAGSSRMLDATSRFAPVDSAHGSLRAFAGAATRRMTPPTAVLVVTGSRLDAAELAGAARLFAPDTTVVGFRCALGESVSRTSLRATTLATIGRLDELPRLVRGLGAARA